MYNYSAGTTILCIDDNDGVLSYHKALLERRGYEVLTAASARQGLRLAEVASVAAVIVDYHMPEMNGHEVATKIKRIRPQVPIVMVSSDRTVPEHALDAVDAFVSKDEVASRLLSVLNRVCRESSSSLPASDRSIA
jgi:CheY-like chemotaxis protein